MQKEQQQQQDSQAATGGRTTTPSGSWRTWSGPGTSSQGGTVSRPPPLMKNTNCGQEQAGRQAGNWWHELPCRCRNMRQLLHMTAGP